MKNTTPTTFQVAQLAAMLAKADGKKTHHELAVKAVELWNASENVMEWLKQEEELRRGVLSFSVEEWRQKRAAYRGDEKRLWSAVLDCKLPRTDVVQVLFKGGRSLEQKEESFLDLLKFSAGKKIPDVIDGEPTDLPIETLKTVQKIRGDVCRLLHVAREMQISANKVRRKT